MARERRCKWLLVAFAAVAGCLMSAPVRAEKVPFDVSPFGNFHINFRDLSTSGGLGMGVVRVYNSFDSGRQGRFGVGWSTQSETYVTVEADGSIVIHEYGGGAPNAFQPTALSRRASKDIVDDIMRAAEETGKFGSDADKAAYRQWLQTPSNEESAWESFASLGLVKQQDPPVGETFFSGQFYTEYVTRVPEGYQREMKYTGGVLFQAFDASGRLTRYWNANHDYISLVYGRGGNITQASDNQGDRLLFSTASDNRVTRINDPPNHLVVYHYKPANNPYNLNEFDLVSVDVDGKTTRYAYDSADRLTSVTYPDQTSMKVTYDKNLRVSSVRDTDGTLTSYTYGLTKNETSTVATFEEKTRKPSGETHDAVFQYFYDAPGFYKDRQIETDDGVVVRRTTYDSNGDELTVTTQAGTWEYRYDSLDRAIFEKEPSGKTLAWQYDPATGNISVETITDNTSTVVENFRYDPEGNLVRAYDNAGHDFLLAYDVHGRIASVTGSALNLSFDYPDARSTQPATVGLAGAGSVSVSYLSNGEVGKAQSRGGVGIVAQVGAALQTVDDLISDAGFHVITLPKETP